MALCKNNFVKRDDWTRKILEGGIMLTKEDIKFIIEEVFADFYENALGKNKSGDYDEDVKRLDIAEKHLQYIYDGLQ